MDRKRLIEREDDVEKDKEKVKGLICNINTMAEE